MISIPLLGIINAAWGNNTPDIKWFHGLFVAIAVYADTHDPIQAIAWGVFFLAWRTPGLSKEGFNVYKRETWREGTMFMIERSKWLQALLAAMLLFATAMGYGGAQPTLAVMMFFPFIVAAIYSGMGWFFPIKEEEDNRIIRVTEYAVGIALGMLITVSQLSN